jgi:single-strand DNA-binding protein
VIINKCMFMGACVTDIRVQTFQGGGKRASFRLAINERKKEGDKWVDSSIYIDCEVWNQKTGRQLADFVEQYIKKGSQIYVEGRLIFDEWTDKETGQPRSRHKIVAGEIQFAGDGGGRRDSGGGQRGNTRQAPAPQAQARNAPPRREPGDDTGYDQPETDREGQEIPF